MHCKFNKEINFPNSLRVCPSLEIIPLKKCYLCLKAVTPPGTERSMININKKSQDESLPFGQLKGC